MSQEIFKNATELINNGSYLPKSLRNIVMKASETVPLRSTPEIMEQLHVSSTPTKSASRSPVMRKSVTPARSTIKASKHEFIRNYSGKAAYQAYYQKISAKNTQENLGLHITIKSVSSMTANLVSCG